MRQINRNKARSGNLRRSLRPLEDSLGNRTPKTHTIIFSLIHFFIDTSLLFFPFAILIFLIFSALGGLQCQKPTPPDVDDTPKPGKRDYTWTIDTLAYPGSYQTLMRDIWASSPTNVYVVGHNDRGYGHMFHFDGKKWKDVDLYFPDSRGNASISLSAIYGFGPNDIYAVGKRIYDNPTPPPNFLDSSLIIHFDGVSWREVPISRKRWLVSISGFKRESLWATGSLGSAYFFDGNLWRLENVPMNFNSEEYNWGVRATSDGKNDYMTISAYLYATGESRHYFWLRSGITWEFKDSFVVSINEFSPRFGAGLSFLPNGELYSFGFGFFKWNGNSWDKIYQGLGGISGVRGTRKEHLFLCESNNKLLHFNGNNWYKYPLIGGPFWTYYSVWCDESEVFIVANDGYKTFIIHGK